MNLTRLIPVSSLTAISAIAAAQGGLISDQDLTLKFNDSLSVSTSLGFTGKSPASRSSQYKLNFGYRRPSWGLRGGVRRTGEEFAPFDTWMGASQLLPRNSQDFSLSGYVSLSPNLTMMGGATRGDSLPGGSFDFTNWSTQLEYRFSSGFSGLLGFDSLDIELMGGSLLRRQWATLGFGMDVGQGNVFKVLLQYGELHPGASGSSTSPSRGHVISGQISVKF